MPQRHKDLRRPSELIAAAGLKKGWKMQLVDLPDGRAAAASRRSSSRRSSRSAATIDIKILTGTQYYSGTPTQTPWLNNPMTITDWGHRGVPNVLLNAALTSKAVPSKKAGTWNAAHFKNKKYDSLVKQFGARPRWPTSGRSRSRSSCCCSIRRP